jgi:superfamily II DNA or RNA helicase
VETAHLFRDALREKGVRAESVWGAMPLEERRLTLKRFEAGELDVLCNCMVLTEGFDSPRAEVCIIATAGAFAWTPEGGWKTVALAEIG